MLGCEYLDLMIYIYTYTLYLYVKGGYDTCMYKNKNRTELSHLLHWRQTALLLVGRMSCSSTTILFTEKKYKENGDS